MRNSIVESAAVVALIVALLGIVVVVWLRVRHVASDKDFSTIAVPRFFWDLAGSLNWLLLLPLQAVAVGAALSIWQSRPLGYSLLDGMAVSCFATYLILGIRAVIARFRAGEMLLAFSNRSWGLLVLVMILAVLFVIWMNYYRLLQFPEQSSTDIVRNSGTFFALWAVFMCSVIFVRNGAYRNGVVMFDSFIPWSDIRDHQFNNGQMWILRRSRPLLQSHLVAVRKLLKSTYTQFAQLLSEQEEAIPDQALPVRTGTRWFVLQTGITIATTVLVAFLFGRPSAASMSMAERDDRVTLSLTDEMLAVRSTAGNVTLLNHDLAVVHQFKSRLKHDIHHVVTATGSKVAVSNNGEIDLLSRSDEDKMLMVDDQETRHQGGQITLMGFDQSDRLFAIVVGGTNRNARVASWENAWSEPQHQLPNFVLPPRAKIVTGNDRVFGVLYSIAGNDRGLTFDLYHVGTEDPVARISIGGHHANTFALSPSGQYFVRIETPSKSSGRMFAVIWDTDSGKNKYISSLSLECERTHQVPVAISDNGIVAVARPECSLSMHNVHDGSCIVSYDTYGNDVTDLVIDNRGRFVVTAHRDRRIRKWTVPTVSVPR